MKTTKKQFKIFKKKFKRLAKMLGLTEWELAFDHSRLGADALGSITPNVQGRVVTVSLNKDWLDEIDLPRKKYIKAIAKHEALELLVEDARYAANDRHSTPFEIHVAFHSLVRRLEKVVDV